LRGDLTAVFKILKGYENIDQEMFFDMSQYNLRGHSLKLNKKKVRLDVAKFSFNGRRCKTPLCPYLYNST